MNALQANISIEELSLINSYKVIGDWSIIIDSTPPAKEILSEVITQFMSCFDWLKFEKGAIAIEETTQSDGKWNSTMDIAFIDWYDQIKYAPETLEYDLIYIQLSAIIKCNSGNSSCVSKLNDLGELYISFEKGKLRVSFSVFINLFTKTAWTEFDSSKTHAEHLMDIGASCRKHNRDLLKNSLHNLGEKIGFHVNRFYSEKMIPYINYQGFSDDCENEEVIFKQ
jgi:hypothetical protein